ncbi:MAG: ADP-ribosylglycohydrolase family protein, partial [Verrucomicrobiota bacterium]
PPAPWHYTDDTVMALSVYRCLEEHRGIHRERLAELFASEYRRDWRRGYGGTAHSILRAIGEGASWQDAAGSAFSGMGSMGNGGAMRVAPLGAYFADDIDRLIIEARYSAEVTHAHPEGQSGAIAIAVAASWAWNYRATGGAVDSRELIEFVAMHTPPGETQSRIRRGLHIPFDRAPGIVGEMLGNGCGVTSPDTVPLVVWCAARHIGNYVEALWATASALGDIDTTCAMVGGIVALSAGNDSIPGEWLAASEPLPL